MSSVTTMAAQIVAAHASKTSLSKEDILSELSEVHKALSALEAGESVPNQAEEQSDEPVIGVKKAFGKKQIYCMICGKGFKTLSRHLRTAHDMTPKEYRKKFDIPSSQSLAAKDYAEKRREMAINNGLADNLARARAKKK